MYDLTDRQQEILSFLHNSAKLRGYPPTLREICQAFGIKSPNGASAHLKALEKKGYIKRTARYARCISIVGLSQPGLPLLGKVS